LAQCPPGCWQQNDTPMISAATIRLEVLMVELESIYLCVRDMQWCKIRGIIHNWTEQLDCSGKFIISLPPGE
jgi:hypothetical protein